MATIDPGDALRKRVLDFFEKNPDETLTAADISRKFSVGIRLVHEALIAPVARGALQLNSHGDYSADPARRLHPLHTALHPQPQAANPATQAAPGTRRPSASLPPLPDPGALRIEAGVPVIQKPNPKGKQSPYTPLFEAMQPGDSVALPTAAARRLIGSAQSLGKRLGRKFLHRQLGEGQSRIWRTE